VLTSALQLTLLVYLEAEVAAAPRLPGLLGRAWDAIPLADLRIHPAKEAAVWVHNG
jgi:hypothetical protein